MSALSKLGGTLIGIVGPPKTGKSKFVESFSHLGKLAVACAPPSERDSYRAAEAAGAYVNIFHDFDWVPRKRGDQAPSFKATGWNELMSWIDTVAAMDDVDVIAIDGASHAFTLAEHEVLKVSKRRTFSGYDDYAAYRSLVIEFIDACLKAAYEHNKTVIVVFHEDVREEEGAGTGVQKGGEVEWEQRKMPAMLSRYRQHIGGHFSLWLFAEASYRGKPSYQLRTIPDRWSAAGSRLPLASDRIDNNAEALLEALV